MTERKLVSADSHVNKLPDLWQQRIDKAFRDRAPVAARQARRLRNRGPA